MRSIFLVFFAGWSLFSCKSQENIIQETGKQEVFEGHKGRPLFVYEQNGQRYLLKKGFESKHAMLLTSMDAMTAFKDQQSEQQAFAAHYPNATNGLIIVKLKEEADFNQYLSPILEETIGKNLQAEKSDRVDASVMPFDLGDSFAKIHEMRVPSSSIMKDNGKPLFLYLLDGHSYLVKEGANFDFATLTLKNPGAYDSMKVFTKNTEELAPYLATYPFAKNGIILVTLKTGDGLMEYLELIQ